MVDDYGTRLSIAMQARGVSAQQLATQLGVSYQAIRKVLLGQSTALTAFNNSRASRFLKVSNDWLATGDGLMEASTLEQDTGSSDWDMFKYWQSASAEAREVARFALSKPDAPLPAWADKDIHKDLKNMLYTAAIWLREDRQEHKKMAV